MRTHATLLSRWLARLFPGKGSRRPIRRAASPPRVIPRLEQVEDRTVPATVLDPNLDVRPVATGLAQPTTMAFLGDGSFFVLEKATGRVRHVQDGGNGTPVLDLPVNSNSERGLLGIALSSNFQNDGQVFLYWTESSTGFDTNVQGNVPLLGNRVDRFLWDGSTLQFDQNIVRLRALQAPNPPVEPGGFGNHDGGVIRFGPDGKLYIIIGDTGRRSWMQNLLPGPQGPGLPDDQFGGPQADDAHLTGVILRLNPDGSIPDDNPFRDVRNVLVANLTGAQEVPPVTTTASGSAVFFLNQDLTALTLQAEVFGLDFTGSQTPDDPGDNLVAAHIHAAATGMPGVNSGVVFGFFGTPFNDINMDVVVTPFTDRVGGVVTSKWDLTEGNNTTLAAQLSNILEGRAYINFHTVEFPGGEIRGQIGHASFDVLDNIHKVFAYGIRNSFGLAFDPFSSDNLWQSENSDDAFEEINRVSPGQNSGWIQVMGPLERLGEFKEIEGIPGQPFFGTQQARYSPTRISDTTAEAQARMLQIPGSQYSDPEVSWRFAVPVGNIGFAGPGSALGLDPLGRPYAGSLFSGGATANTEGGHLFRFQLNADRSGFVFDDPGLNDLVADNLVKHSLTESESLLFGTEFGVVTDIHTGPNGNLYVVSNTQGTVFEIFRRG